MIFLATFGLAIYLDGFNYPATPSLLYALFCLMVGYQLGWKKAILASVCCQFAHALTLFINRVPLSLEVLWESSMDLVLTLGMGWLASRQAYLVESLRSTRQLLEGHLEQARRVQLMLLPNPAQQIQNLHLAVRHEVAVALGGDLFMVKELPEGVFLLLADVSGKGPRAALVAAVFKTLVEEALLHSQRPDQILQRVQSRFLKMLPEGVFVTCFCCQVEWSGQLNWCNAGHEPALLCRSCGPLELGQPNLPVGVDESEVYELHSESLQCGDRLLVFSDGLSESPAFASERVDQHLSRHPEDLSALADSLMDLAERPYRDDTTVLCLKYVQ